MSIATPYTDAMNAHEVAFLKAHGIETLAIEGLGLGANGPCDFPLIAQTPLETIDALARKVTAKGAEALLITCTDFPSLPLIARLEQVLGLPVISSNTATLWAALRKIPTAPARLEGGGRLLSGAV